MAQVINTNVQSLNAQRNLNNSALSLSTALQRLSSGLRINSAKDDAAGLAISERFSTQIRGLNVAVRNANDGISLSQTAEGALGEISNNLQRIRELSVQARNSTNSASDRAALNAEVQQRLAEIERTAAQTSFNGQKILDGTFGKATFQVGSNAGEVISLNLDSSTRNASIGKISEAISNALGATATGGSVATGEITGFDFSAAGDATGGVTLSAATYLFDNVPFAGTQGTTTISQAQLGGDFNFATANAQAGVNVQSISAGLNAGGGPDFSGAGNLAQFDVSLDGGATIAGTVTLTGDYSGVNGGTDLAADIQAQLTGVTVAYDDASGNLTFTNTSGTPATAVQILNTDDNGAAFGFTDSAGLAGAATETFTFQVDGNNVSLSTDLLSGAGVAAAIQGQLTGYAVNFNAGNYEIVNTAVGSAAPVITATNAYAATSGVEAANTTGVDGLPAVSANSIEFVVDGQAILFDDTTASAFTSFDDVAAAIQGELDTAFGLNSYTVTADGADISIVNNDGVTPVAVTASTDVDLAARAAAAGFGPTAGSFSGAATFTVDGNTVNLNANYTNAAGLAAALDTQLAGYTVTGDNGTGVITITNDVPGSAAVVIAGVGTGSNAEAAGFANATGTAGIGAGTVTLATGGLTILDGTGKTSTFGGSYANAQALADDINANANGVFASISTDGKLQLQSAQAFTVGGADAATLGFSTTEVAATNGSLADVNVLTKEASDEAIVRVDSALQSISSLRSDFGAVQNRFESTIANLQTTAENLAASRSRILDADFAAETAALTRAQILQQAGVAILAQANQLPQNVLSLLR